MTIRILRYQMIKCKQCGEVFKHIREDLKGSKKEYCGYCISKRRNAQTKKSQAKAKAKGIVWKSKA